MLPRAELLPYKTKEYSPETGLIFFGARYYNPLIGRFITKDPMGMVDGPNLYVYLNNDPINKIDPYGLGAISNSVQGQLKDRYGDSLTAADRKEMGDAFEKAAEDLGLAGDFVGNEINIFKNKKEKEKTRKELGEKVAKELEKRAENDQKLKELKEKLEKAEKEKKCP